MLLEAQSLSKSFGKRRVLNDLSLTLKPGEVLGVIGESGCGKSTLARLLIGLVQPELGQILYEGRPPSQLTRRDRARFIQLMFQDPGSALHPRLRIGEALREVVQAAYGLRRLAAEERILSLMPKLDLETVMLDRFPHQLSGGQKQRVCLLRALLLKPQVLVCDEPLTALDRMTQARVLQLLKELREELGFAMIIISHDITTVRSLADTVGVMYAGQWMEYGPAASILHRPQHPYTQYLLQSLPKLYRDPSLQPMKPFLENMGTHPERGCPLVGRCPQAREACAKLDAASLPNPSVRCVEPGVFAGVDSVADLGEIRVLKSDISH